MVKMCLLETKSGTCFKLPAFTLLCSKVFLSQLIPPSSISPAMNLALKNEKPLSAMKSFVKVRTIPYLHKSGFLYQKVRKIGWFPNTPLMYSVWHHTINITKWVSRRRKFAIFAAFPKNNEFYSGSMDKSYF